MKNTFLLLPVILLFCARGFAQSAPAASASTGSVPAGVTKETWDPAPSLHPIDPKYAKESAIILTDIRRMEYVDEGKDEIGLYRTLHRVVRLNDDKGIESFNKIYLGVTDNSDIVDIRARTILPGGKVIEIDKQNIKDLKEEDGNMYKIFAMEGLEKGCEVEYYYTFRRPAVFFGREQIQGEYPVLHSRIEIRGPERLGFQLKGYNCTVASSDTVKDGKRILSAELGNVGGAEKEKYAAYEANLERVEFKLSYNSAVSNGNVRLFTWNELAKRVYSIYGTYTEKEEKAAEELIRHNKWDQQTAEPARIVTVENYLKAKIATRDDINTDDADNIEWVLKNGIASKRGIIRLYGALFKKLGIDAEIVLCCDRSEAVIDRNFENWNSTSEFLIYFPAEKKYLAPTLLTTRYPWIDPYWGAEDALFCKTTTIGTFTTAIAEIKPIQLEDYTESFNRIDAKLKLNDSQDTLLVDMTQSYGGYSAGGYRAEYTLSNPEEQRTFIKELVKFGTNSENIVTSKVENGDFESYSDNKPFTLEATVKASELLENAGNKLLVKIGEVIGAQSEMYQEKPRQFPVMIPFPHTLERTIQLEIPAGYTIRNPNDLNIHNEQKDDNGQVTMGFTSEYTMEGNLLKVHVMEQYRRVSYSLAEYATFQKVINTAADFNKIVLVLEKKQ